MSRQSSLISEETSINVYDATADAYVMGAKINDALVAESPHHTIKARLKGRRVVLDPLAPDYRDMFIEKGTAMAPDELLHLLRPLTLKIPLKLREDFEDPNALPDSDLLKAIHYYASNAEIVTQSMDETALLALGSLAEMWAEEEVNAHDPLLFIEPDESLDLLKYAAPDWADSQGGLSSGTGFGETKDDSDGGSDLEKHMLGWEGEESDVMSIDLLESDTASEVEGGRHIKRIKQKTEVLDDTNNEEKNGKKSAKKAVPVFTDSDESGSSSGGGKYASSSEGSGEDYNSTNGGGNRKEFRASKRVKDTEILGDQPVGIEDNPDNLGDDSAGFDDEMLIDDELRQIDEAREIALSVLDVSFSDVDVSK